MSYDIISSNTTWAAGSEHALTSDVQIAAGATLTIESGAVVQGNGHAIDTFGTLDVAGSAGNMVQLNNVQIVNRGSSAQNSYIKIDYSVMNGGLLLDSLGVDYYGSFLATNSDFFGVQPVELAYPSGVSKFQYDLFQNSGGIHIGTNNVNVSIDHIADCASVRQVFAMPEPAADVLDGDGVQR